MTLKQKKKTSETLCTVWTGRLLDDKKLNPSTPAIVLVIKKKPQANSEWLRPTQVSHLIFYNLYSHKKFKKIGSLKKAENLKV